MRNFHKFVVARLRQARSEAGLDQTEVARLLNRTQSYISKVECGWRRVSVAELDRFAKVYGKPTTYFVRGFPQCGAQSRNRTHEGH